MSERPQQQETVVFEFAALPASIRRKRFHLKQEDGQQELVTSEPRVVIGSGPSADFLVPDATVSRLHCEIVADEGGYLIRDLGSTNGTVIGGVRVKEAYLASATRIRAGRATVRFSLLDNLDEVALYPDISFGEMVARSAAMRALFGATAPVPVDVRVISATNRNLRREVNNRTFREDLFYRLAVTSATLPALRERTEDIPLLIDHFLAQHSAKDGFKYELDRHTRRRLHERAWPGNIRELRNVVEELVILGEESEHAESPTLASGAVTLGIEPNGPSGTGEAGAIGSFKE